MHLLRALVFILICVTIAIGSPGQVNDTIFYRLDADDLVSKPDSGLTDVTAASRTARKTGELPLTVYVITREEILGNGYTTLTEALSSLPGIRVSTSGSAIDGEMFQIRGVYGNYYCQVMVDGITIKPSATGGMPLAAQLPVRQAERIEVIFGPASSVYGAEALAGVINIVTLKSDRPVTAQADIALGSNNYEYLNVTIGGKLGKNKNVLTYSLFGNTSTRKDLPVKYDRDYLYNPSLYDSSYTFLDQPYFKGDSNSIAMDRMPRQSRLLGLTLHWRGLTAQAMSMTRSSHSSFGRNPALFSYNDPTNLWQDNIQRIHLSYNKSWKKFSSTTLFSWLIYRTDKQSNFGMLAPVGETGKAYRYAASDDLSFEEQLSYVPFPGLELLAGAQYSYSGNLPLSRELYEPFNTNDYRSFSAGNIADTSVFAGFGLNPLTFHRAGAYVQAFYQLNRFTFLASYRFDYHSLFDPAHSPKLAVMYKAKKDWSLRASIATGYRVPSLHYMYSSSASRSGQGIYYDIVPNTELQPERLIAAEAGVRWEKLSWLNIDAALFYHRIYEQFTRSFVLLDTGLYPLAVNPLGLTRAYVNDRNSLAELIGLQASFGFRNLFPAIDLRVDLDLALSKGREVLPNDLGKIDDYRQMPVFFSQLDISFRPQERINFLIRNNLSSGWVRGYLPLDPDLLRSIGYPVDIDGYYTLDILARLTLSRNFEAFAHFENLTNVHYAGLDAYADENDLFYNPQPGFMMHIGLSFKME